MTAPLDDRQTVLYRFYDREGRLLYVGISADFPRRAAKHRRKPWWRQRARTTLQPFPTRDLAAAAEREAIITEHPRYNIIYNDRSAGAKPARIGELEGFMLTLCDSQIVPWGSVGEHMPDDCHDICAKQGILGIYHPYRWTNGTAHYVCEHEHRWTCSWGHHLSGDDPASRGVNRAAGAPQ